MTKTLDQKIAAASFSYEDVIISLDGLAGKRRDALYEQLDRALKAGEKDPRLSAGNSEAVRIKDEIESFEAEMSENLIHIRFRPIGEEKWKQILGANPPKPGNLLDKQRGYDTGGVAKAVASWTGSFVEEIDPADPDTAVLAPIEARQWTAMWPAMTPGDAGRIEAAIFKLNQTDSWTRTAFLGAASTKTPTSDAT